MVQKALIILDCNSRGGAERSSYYFCKVLKRLGWNIELCFFEYNDSGYDFREFGNLKRFSASRSSAIKKASKLWAYKKFVLENFERKFDLIFTVHDFSHIVSSLLINKLSGKRVFSERKYSEVYFGKKNVILKKIYRYFYYFSDIVLVNDIEIKESLINYYKFINRIEVVNNYVDTVTVKSQGNDSSSFSISNEKLNIVIIGRLSSEKGQSIAIKAIAGINEQVNLHLIGSGPDLDSLTELSEELGVRDSVFFHGVQENPFSIANQCQLCICTSYSEGFPNAIIESMALGLPIISLPFKSGLRSISNEGEYISITRDRSFESLREEINKFIEDDELLFSYSQLSLLRSDTYGDFELLVKNYKAALSI